MKRSLASVLLAMLVSSGCSSVEVSAELDPLTHFDAYRTYAWVTDEPLAIDDPRIDPLALDGWVREAVDHGLTIRGLQRDAEDPDLLVAYRGTLEGGTQIFQVLPGEQVRAQDTYVRHYERGAIIVDIFDADGPRLVFTATAEGDVHYDLSPDERRERVRDAVRRMLDRLPRRATETARARWVHDDGSEVSDDEFHAAVASCEADAQVTDGTATTRAGHRFRSWGAGMLRCLATKDVHLGNPPAE